MTVKKRSLRFPLLYIGILQIIMLAAISFPPTLPALLPLSYADQPTPTWPMAVTALVDQADVAVRAQVVASRSQWNSDHTLIETEYKLTVYYTLLGQSTPELQVRTDGGFLAEEGLGMRSSHTATFVLGEEVLVFLSQMDNSYAVVGGEAGKFSVFHGKAVSSYYHAQQALDQLAATIAATAASRGRSATLPANWRSYEPAATIQVSQLSNQPRVDPKWPGAAPKIKAAVNLNSTQIGEQGGSADQFLTALRNALRSWSVVETAEFTLLYDGETTATNTGFNNKSEILFMHKGVGNLLGQAQIWFTSNGTIVEADIWINDDYSIDATGNPQTSEIDLESVVLHELGHWLPLGHLANPNAVMYAVLNTGIRKTELTSDDIDGINALYPCPAVPCIDPIYVGDRTPTPTATATPPPTSTPTPTHTPTLTATPLLIPTADELRPERGVYLPLIMR